MEQVQSLLLRACSWIPKSPELITAGLEFLSNLVYQARKLCSNLPKEDLAKTAAQLADSERVARKGLPDSRAEELSLLSVLGCEVPRAFLRVYIF